MGASLLALAKSIYYREAGLEMLTGGLKFERMFGGLRKIGEVKWEGLKSGYRTKGLITWAGLARFAEISAP